VGALGGDATGIRSANPFGTKISQTGSDVTGAARDVVNALPDVFGDVGKTGIINDVFEVFGRSGPNVSDEIKRGLPRIGDTFGSAMGFLSNFLGGEQIGANRAVDAGGAAVTTAMERLGDHAMKGATSAYETANAAAGPVSAPGFLSILTAADSFVGNENVFKPITATGKALDPTQMVAGGAKAAGDLVRLASHLGDDSSAGLYRAADAVQDKGLKGEYSVLGQAGTMLAGLVGGDTEMVDRLIGTEAASGDLGIFPALGNYVADTLMGTDDPWDNVPVAMSDEEIHDRGGHTTAELNAEVEMEGILSGRAAENERVRRTAAARRAVNEEREGDARAEDAARAEHEAALAAAQRAEAEEQQRFDIANTTEQLELLREQFVAHNGGGE
jgi:hypothetical protein